MKKDIKYILILVIISLFFYNNIIFKFDEILNSSDIYDLSYPYFSFFNEYFSKGEIPLWNPYNFFGESFIGNAQTSMFYIFNYIFSQIFSTNYVFTFGIIFHTILSGTFMYFLCKNFNLSSKASLVSSILFMFNSFIANRFGHYMIFCAISYLPLIFLLFKKSLDKKSLYFSLLTGFFVGITFFVGHVQVTFYSILALFIFWLYNFFINKIYKNKKQILKYFFLIVIPLVFSVLISAAQFLPSLELSTLTLRNYITYEYASIYSMSIENYINMFLPNFFGNGASMPTWLKGLSYGEMSPYIGIFPLFLVLFAIYFKRKNKTVLFFSLLLLMSFIFSFGNYILFKIPILGSFRAYARILFISNFSISILAGFGFEFFISNIFKKNKALIFKLIKYFSIFIILFFILCSVIVLFKVYNQFNSMNINIESNSSSTFSKINYQGKSFSIIDSLIFSLKDLFYFILFYIASLTIIFTKLKNNNKYMAYVVILFIIFNLFFFNYGIIKTIPLDLLDTYNEINSYKDNLGLYRYFDTLDQGYSNIFNKYFNIRGNNPLAFYDSELFFSNNYDYKTYFNITTNYNDLFTYEKYDLMGVKYIFSDILINDPSLILLNETNKYFIYENINVLPRAFLLSNETKCNRTFKSSLNYIVKDDYLLNLSNYCLYPINISNYSINEVVLSLNTSNKGFVVLTDTYYPGWKVYINENETQIMKYSNIFRAVEINQNTEEILFSYEPESFKLGIFLSKFSLIFFAIVSSIKIINIYKRQ